MSTFNEWWTGTDTNAALPFPAGSGVAPEHFYIGRIGGETTASVYGFDIKAAKAATKTFAYWDLAGPGTIAEPAIWGSKQAESFFLAVTTQHYVQGRTLFLDVESGNGGWGTHIASNQATFAGALNALALQHIVPGVYISEYEWVQFFGSASWSPDVPFVLWLAGNADPTLGLAIASWDRLPTLGGMQPMLWQYNSSGSTASPLQDRNLTPYGGWLDGAWKPTPVATVVKPAPIVIPATKTPIEVAMAQLNTAATELQKGIELVQALQPKG